MLILVLGKGKTGSLVAEVARERGHGVRALDINENRSRLRAHRAQSRRRRRGHRLHRPEAAV
jgi:Trk K+ transport system NAD-binding subunit